MPHDTQQTHQGGHRHEHRGFGGDRERRPEPEPIATERIEVDGGRKIFFLDLKENQRGRFLALKEKVGMKQDRVLIPVDALPEMIECLTRLLEHSNRL